MKTQVEESDKSTPEAPLWWWRVWCDGREVAVGFCPSQEEARQEVERARAIAERRAAWRW